MLAQTAFLPSEERVAFDVLPLQERAFMRLNENNPRSYIYALADRRYDVSTLRSVGVQLERIVTNLAMAC